MSEVRKETGEKWWSCDDSSKRMLKVRNIRWSLSCIWFLPCWWWGPGGLLKSLQFSCSVVSNSLWLMDCSTPGLPVHHQLPELAHAHVHRVGDAIQPSHPLSSPFPPAFNLSQHQGLFQWVSSSHQVAKVLEFQPQHQSFQWTSRTGLL